MKLEDFVKQPRGPYRFDLYVHPDVVPSPLGEFVVELIAEVGQAPADVMLEIARALVEQFTDDRDHITGLVFREYERACRMVAAGVPDDAIPRGLSISALGAYLDVRTLSVSCSPDDEEEPYPARVYLSPRWDSEHGLYFRFFEGEWEKVDC